MTTYGHTASYPTGCGGAYEHDAASCPASQKQDAYAYLRANPHRLNLGRMFLASATADLNEFGAGTELSQSLLQNFVQEHDMWSGILTSNFTLNETAVQVTTAVGTEDVVAVQLRSELLLSKNGAAAGLHLAIAFPYGSETFSGPGADWTRPHDHTSTLSSRPRPGGGPGVQAVITRVLDDDAYTVTITVEGAGSSVVQGQRPHLFEIHGGGQASTCNVTVSFASTSTLPSNAAAQSTFDKTLLQSAASYKSFWESGAMIDFSGSTDARAAVLEKQVIMSLYMGRSQEAGRLPPQETGLVSNSWYGKFHGEMRMWHQAMLVAFGHTELFARSTEYYLDLLDEAKGYAKLQGYKGARWFKMRGKKTNTVFTGPSAVGPLLLQEQPHPIVYAELLYRAANSTAARTAALNRYGDIVQATADFMASFVLMADGHDTRGCINLVSFSFP
eukprot:SAG22_NODE_477_length_9978_cov_2.807268_7_plen_445_part_00